jgi:hypothetical protein
LTTKYKASNGNPTIGTLQIVGSINAGVWTVSEPNDIIATSTLPVTIGVSDGTKGVAAGLNIATDSSSTIIASSVQPLQVTHDGSNYNVHARLVVTTAGSGPIGLLKAALGVLRARGEPSTIEVELRLPTNGGGTYSDGTGLVSQGQILSGRLYNGSPRSSIFQN